MAFQECSPYARSQKSSERKFFRGNFGFLILITVTLVAMALGDDFSCGRPCTCRTFNISSVKIKYEVVCSLPEGKDFVLTEDIFGRSPTTDLKWMASIKIFGNSEIAGRVLIRRSFLKMWQEFNTSLLELKDLSNLSFERHTLASYDVIESFFGSAAITISGCHIDLLPGGLFVGKDLAGLSIVSSTVAVIDQGLLVNIGGVDHFHVKDSSIGIFRGPMSTFAVTVHGPPDDSESVIIGNSSIAILKKDSLHFLGDPFKDLNMKFSWVIVGTIEQEAIIIEDFAFVHFDNNVIMDFHREGLIIQKKNVHLYSNTMVTPRDEISNCSYCGHGTTVRNNILMVPDALLPSSPEVSWEVVSESSCLCNSIFISHDLLVHPKVPKPFVAEVEIIVFFLMALCTFLLTLIITWVVYHCYCSMKKSWSSREILIHRMRLIHHDDSMRNTFTRFQEDDLTHNVTDEQEWNENRTTIESETIPHPHDQITKTEVTKKNSYSKDLNSAELKDSIKLTRKPSEEIQEPSDEDSKNNITETSLIGGISSRKSEDSFQNHCDASSVEENSSEKTNEDIAKEHREISSAKENSFDMADEGSPIHKAEHLVDDNPLNEAGGFF